jgi:ribosomal-protein-alanine N-acetyltransferase
MKFLETERLRLFPMDCSQWRMYLEDPCGLEGGLGFSVSRAILTDRVRRAILMKLEKMAHAEDSRHGWYTYWLIVLKKPPFGAGMAGFKGFPDERGEAEIGYGIDPAYEHRGIMTETVKDRLAGPSSPVMC